MNIDAWVERLAVRSAQLGDALRAEQELDRLQKMLQLVLGQGEALEQTDVVLPGRLLPGLVLGPQSRTAIGLSSMGASGIQSEAGGRSSRSSGLLCGSGQLKEGFVNPLARPVAAGPPLKRDAFDLQPVFVAKHLAES